MFRVEVEVAAPPERLWACVVDVADWPRWTPSMTSATPEEAGPLAVGSRVRIRQPRLPEARWRVSRLVPGRGFAWVSTVPGMVTEAGHEVCPAGAGHSRLVLTLTMRGPLAGLVRLVYGRLVRRYMGWEADGLRRAAEAG